MSDNTLDLTVELAPRARFDLVDLRRHFADEHAALASYPRTSLLVLSHDRRVSRARPGGASQRPAAFRPTSRRSGRCFPKAPATSTTGSNGARTSTRRSAPSSRATPTRIWRSWPAACAPASRTRTGPASRCSSSISTASTTASRGGAAPGSSGFTQERVVGTTRIEVPVSAHPIDSINLKDPRLGVYAAARGVRQARRRRQGHGCASRSTPPSATRR